MLIRKSATDVGDHVHEVTLDDGVPVRMCHFPFAALDPEIPSLVAMETVTAGFIKILDWVQSGSDFKAAGARVAALRVLLDPVNGRYRSLSQIASDSGISRAALSHALTALCDSCGVRLSFRMPGARANCRRAQLAAVAAGTHASRKEFQ